MKRRSKKRDTSAWLRDASDELAVRNGCWFDPLMGGYVVWWIERFCRLYEGEHAGEPLWLRGRHDETSVAWPIADQWDDEAKATALERHDHYVQGRRDSVPCDWQYEFHMRLYGWQRKSERWGRDIRRFRQAGVWIPKKNKKSPTLAANGLYLIVGDGEPGQKVAICAKDGLQARDIAGKHAIEMAQSSRELAAECKVNLNECSVTHIGSRSILRPFSSSNERTKKSKEGFNGSVLVDETHVVDRDFMRRLSRAGISRSEPLQIEVSTAGNDPDGYGKERFDYGADVASGKTENDQFLYISHSAPQAMKVEDLPTTEEVIRLGRLTNPAMGHTVDEGELLSDWSQSQRTVGDTLDFLMYRLNVWQHAVNPWIPMWQWAACRDEYTLESLRGEPAVIGFDKSRNRDFTAFVALVPEWGEGGLERFSLWPWIVAPRQYIREHEQDGPFQDWVRDGLLIESPGDVIDVGFLYDLFGTINEHFEVIALAYDPNRAEEITQLIEQGATAADGEKLSEGYGIQRVPVGTSSAIMASAVDEFEAFVRDELVRHPGHAVLDWMLGNTQAIDRGDRTKLEKPKKKDTKKIDGIIAAVVAFAVARNDEFRPEWSVYETRGVLSV